jgi:hypothetical protein
MKFISHRGNLDKKIKEEENTIPKIEYCISLGFDVEIDIWDINDQLYLGHDNPEQKVDFSFLESNRQFLWIHTKNIHSLYKLKDHFNCFWHQEDDYTLTSAGYIWTYPCKKIIKNSIAVMPELANYDLQDLRMCYGICSDNIEKYRNLLQEIYD